MFKNTLAVLAVITASTTGFAAGSGHWEIGGGATGIASLRLSPSTAFSFGINGSAGYMVANGIQIVLDPTLALASSTFIFGATVGPRFNFSFSNDIKNDIFAGAGFMFLGSTATGSTFAFGIDVNAGKRFALSDSVAFRPYVQFLLGLQTGGTATLNFVPLSFSILL